jgi:hypothetical protein
MDVATRRSARTGAARNSVVPPEGVRSAYIHGEYIQGEYGEYIHGECGEYIHGEYIQGLVTVVQELIESAPAERAAG